jgi:hypothetical protein
LCHHPPVATLVISYSRSDRTQVRAVVALLRAALRDIEKAVFWDEDFEPGDSWFEQIRRHIDEAPQLFVFWCHHAARSEQVRREFLYAFACGKRVVPVLLDSTVLAPELAPIHGIDLREAVLHTPAPGGVERPTRASRKHTAYPRSFAPAALAATVVAMLASSGLLVWYRYLLAPSSIDLPSTSPGPVEPPPTPSVESVPYIAIVVALALLLLACWAIYRFVSSPRATPAVTDSEAIVHEQRIVNAFAPYIAETD